MASLKLRSNAFLKPTPAGVFYAVSEVVDTPPRRLLNNLLGCSQTPEVTEKLLNVLCENENLDQSLRLLHRLHSLRWVQGLDSPLLMSNDSLEEILPGLLFNLTENGKALLADAQGFYLATAGFAHETAEELAALSADVLKLQDRHAGLLLNNLNIGSQAWGVVDASGNSRLGIWPLHIGKHRFALVMTGIPHFNHPNFVHLVWTIATRYAPFKTQI
ncbi:MAG TPA: hypothetical protein ENJ32_02445 [Crenotrichaceae bacterium]|nr:hypothetical protein [Crenotrichaceae bacterium]